MNNEEKIKIEKQREELRKKLEEDNKKEKNKIREIDYYKELQLINNNSKYMGFMEKDVFVVSKEEKINGKKIKTLEVYNKNLDKIASTDKNGLLNLEPEYKDELKEKLKDYYPQLGLDDKKREIYLHEHEFEEEGKNFISKENGVVASDKKEKDLTEEDKKKEIEKLRDNRKNKVDTLDSALVKEDLGIDTKDLGTMIKIKDKRFYDKVPDAKDFNGDALLIYNNKTNKFMIIGMKKGKYVECKGIEPSVGTMKTSVDLDKTGKYVQEQGISSVMKLKGNNDYDFAVNLEAGAVEFQELRRGKNGKYISADLCTQGQHSTSYEVEKMMDKGKNRSINDELDEFNKENEHGHSSSVQSLKNKNCTKEEIEETDKANQKNKSEISKRREHDGHEDREIEDYDSDE